jgi:prevent-host-death family protein
VEIVNIHQAKTHLSRLIERLAGGGAFIIAKAGKPVAKVVPVSAPDVGMAKRLGFMAGQFTLPDDFDRMGGQEIERQFGGQD